MIFYKFITPFKKILIKLLLILIILQNIKLNSMLQTEPIQVDDVMLSWIYFVFWVRVKLVEI